MTQLSFLITGASSGIGEAFARAYAKRGYSLTLVARRLDRLEALAAELKTHYNTNSTCIACDLSESAAVTRLIETIKTQNLRVDGLINNAGYSVARTYAATDWKSQADFICVCVTTPSQLTHAFLPAMIARGFGRIINLSSIAAFSEGASGHTLYPAAKSFMLKFSRSLAAEVKDKGVFVTALCPGATQSEFHDANGMKDIMHKNPLPSMTALSVVELGIEANEAGREVIVPGLTNKIATWAMAHLPDGFITPLVRKAAKKYQLKD